MADSPTKLTLRHLRKSGYPLVQVVEKWNSFAQVRQDLFGVIDVLAVRQNKIVAVQCTSSKNVASRLKKIRNSKSLPVLKAAGVEVVVHGWRKTKPGGVWVLREVIV